MLIMYSASYAHPAEVDIFGSTVRFVNRLDGFYLANRRIGTLQNARDGVCGIL